MVKKKFIPLIALAAIIPILSISVFSTNEPLPYTDKHTTIASGLRANLSPLELAEMADVIVQGKIVNVETQVHEKDKERGIILVYSIIELEPIKFFKGKSSGNLFIKQLGGETADYRTVSEYLSLKANDVVMMHLTLDDEGVYFNPFSGTTTTYLLENGIAKNYYPLDLDISEDKLVSDYNKLVKSLNTEE